MLYDHTLSTSKEKTSEQQSTIRHVAETPSFNGSQNKNDKKDSRDSGDNDYRSRLVNPDELSN